MNNKLYDEILKYEPYNEQEEADRKVMLGLMESQENLFSRDNLVCHMTASGWVLNPDHTKVLMAYHNLYDSWAWLGGHADGEEDLLSVAIREVKEESGIERVKAVSNAIYSLEILTVAGHVKRGAYVPCHLHLNVTYLLEADDTEQVHIKEDENSAVGWFTPEDAIAHSSEPWFQEHIYSKLNEKLSQI